MFVLTQAICVLPAKSSRPVWGTGGSLPLSADVTAPTLLRVLHSRHQTASKSSPPRAVGLVSPSPHLPSGCAGPPSAERLGDRSARHVHRAQLEEMSTSTVFVCDPMQLFMEIFCGLHANTYGSAAHWFVAKICIVLAKCLPVSVILSLSKALRLIVRISSSDAQNTKCKCQYESVGYVCLC